MIDFIETLLTIAKALLALLPFLLLCWAGFKVNMAKEERNKQLLMPVFALVYVLIAMLLLNTLTDWLLYILDSIPRWLASLSFLPQPVGGWITQAAAGLRNLLNGLNLHYWVFFLANAVIIAVYLLLKQLCLGIMEKAIKTDGSLHTKISGIFYGFFSERNCWCVRSEYAQVRKLLRVLYYGALTLSAVLMIVSRYLYSFGLLEAMFYPVFGVLVVGELYFYLDGLTRREYANDVLGEDEDAYKTVNYSLLRKFLRSLFGDKLLTENTSINNALTYDVTTDQIIRELEKSEDPKVASFAAFYGGLNGSGFTVDHNYLYSSLDMLEGKSVLFNNPFYNDLIPYAFYPLNRTLLSHRKVLVVLGRHAIEEDIRAWLEKGIESVTNIPFLWNIGLLDKDGSDMDIGIVTRSAVLDMELHNANASFLRDVGFVVVIEPSKLISTAQIGLNMLVKQCQSDEKHPVVYCLCDKNCDGLVDAMSHILMTNITEVAATNKHLGTSSYMCWEPDGEHLHHRLIPNISRYLGVGTELSFAALKNQVSKTKWYGGEAFPVTDMHWIAKQYYYDLTRYATLPTSQEAMDERFETSPNFWSAEVEKHKYITVEDEACNMFEILRDFSTRTTEQGFINVISTDYLLKDYMADNAGIFEADPKAVPYIVADFTRSMRNTVLRLLLMMGTFPVSYETLEKEFSLQGIPVFDLRKQLWYEIFCCFARLADIEALELPEEYAEAVEKVYAATLPQGEFTVGILRVEEKFSLRLGRLETTYRITDTRFLSMCVTQLRSAGYVAEDEKGQQYFLGAELSGHIYQRYLPGQFFTFGGKYYEMQHLTADGQVLVRRAADHINGRTVYRQLRRYTLCGVRPSDRIGAQRDIGGLKVTRQFADITVDTPGYYRMERYNDFATAKKVSFEGDKNGIPQRVYCNKELLCIELPELDGKRNDTVRYTVTMLLNELFRTVFAENQAFISAVTDLSFMESEEGPLTYSLYGDGYEINPNAIYIIEDSQLDMGLTVAAERHLERLLGIIQDYLDWHASMLEESLVPPPEPPPPIIFTEPTGEEKPKKGIKKVFGAIGNFFKKIGSFVAGLFRRKKKGDPAGEEPVPTGEEPTPPGEDPIPPGEDPVFPGEDPVPPTGGEPAPTGEEPIPPVEEPKKGLFGWRRKKKKKEPDPVPPVEPVVPTEEPVPTGEEPLPVGGEPLPVGEEPAPLGEPAPAPVPGGEDPVLWGEEPVPAPVPAPAPEEPKKKGLFGWLKRKKKPQPDPTPATPVDPVEAPVYGEDPLYEEPVSAEEPVGADPLADPGEGVDKQPAEVAESPLETEEIPAGPTPEPEAGTCLFAPRKPYHQRYFTLFGGDSESAQVDMAGALAYLTALGLGRNGLKQARDGKNIADLVESTFKPGRPDARYCDFCGAEIYGVEYETLADGRDRCLNCGRTAIKTGEEFRKIFEDVRRNMESFFGIRIDAGIKVEMVNAKTLHKRLGEAYIPTADQDGRVLGVAISDRHGYTLMVENGSPRMASMLTMAHELTHIWQYLNWNDKHIKKTYGKGMRLQIYEGMAKWVEIQYAYLINEPAVAKREDIITSHRQDEYGFGFLRYKAAYPFSLGTVITKPTPFLNVAMPLDPEFCGNFEPTPPPTGGGGAPGGVIPPGGTTPTGVLPPKPIEGPIDRNPGTVSYYAFSQLTAEEQTAYTAILEAIKGFVPELSEFGVTLTKTQLSKITSYIQWDHPEIFWFQGGETFYFDPSTEIISRVEFPYNVTPDQVRERQAKIDAAIGPFLASVQENMSDYEVTLRIYENIIKLVDYDTIGLERQKKLGDNREGPDDLRSIYGVFVDKKAVCAGYAKATQYLLQRFGIECTYISSGGHAWNMLKLEGDYYHLDTTWGDSSDTKKEKDGGDAISYDCFCITTADLSRLDSHTPVELLPLPTCTATKCNYHVRHGLYFDRYDFNRVRTIVCEKLQADEWSISFKFASAAVYAEAKRELVENSRLREALQYANLKGGVRVDGSYSYITSDEKWILTFRLKKL